MLAKYGEPLANRKMSLPVEGEYLGIPAFDRARQGELERYAFRDLLGRSRHAASFLALDRGSDELVVVRGIEAHVVPAGQRLRVRHGARLLEGQPFGAVARLVRFHQLDEALFLTSEFVPGVDLRRAVRRERLGVVQALRVAADVLRGLSELHSCGVLHGEVTPSHVVVSTTSGELRAKLIEAAAPHVAGDEDLGGPAAIFRAGFASPEQLGAIEHDLGPCAELYSAGAVLFYALTGRPPFLGKSVGDVLFNHMTAPPTELAEAGVSAPRILDFVLGRLLQKDPRNRYQSAEAALADVAAILDSLLAGESEPSFVLGLADVRGGLTDPEFVGRERELKQLVDLARAASDGRGGLVLLEAESGGGKSRLLSEAMQCARREGAWALRGEESNEVARRPLSLFDGVVREIASAAEHDESLREHLRRRLQEERATLTFLFPQLAGLFGDDASSATTQEHGEARVLWALSALLSALGRPGRPAVVVLDDMQWADNLACKLLAVWQTQHRNSDAPCNVLVIAAARADELSDDHALRRCAPVAHLALQPLGDQDVAKLAESMGGKLPSEVVDVVTRLAEGSPFMASAVLRGLVECGALNGSPSGWAVDAERLSSCQSSQRVGELLAQRIERLGESVGEMLAIGAVLGAEFSVDFAARLAGTSIPLAAIDEARAKKLIWVRPDQSTCVFMHDKIREALLAKLPEDRRSAIHRKAAELLARQPLDHDAAVSFHFDASGDAASALPYALRAAASARGRHSLEGAEQQYRIALRAAESLGRDQHYHVWMGLAEVLLRRGRYIEAGEALREAHERARGRVAQATVRGKLAELSLDCGDMESAIVAYGDALRTLGVRVPQRPLSVTICLVYQAFIQLLHTALPGVFVHRRAQQPSEGQRLELHLLSGLAHSAWYGRGRSLMFWAHLRGMNRAEVFTASAQLARTYSEHAVGMSLFGLFSRALKYSQRSLKIRIGLDDVWGQGQSLLHWGMALYCASRYRDCIAKCREAVRLLERTGDFQQAHTAQYQVAASLYRLGDLEAAVDESTRCRRSGLALGDAQASGINLDVWARASLGAVPQEALDEELARKRFDVQGAAQVKLAQAVCLVYDDRLQEAKALLQEAWKSTRRSGVANQYTVPITAWMATVARRLVECQGAFAQRSRREALREAARTTRLALRWSRACRNDRPRVLREAALMAALRGHSRRAYSLLRRSLHLARRQDARYEFAETLLAAAEIGEQLGWARAEQRRRRAERRIESLIIRATSQHAGANNEIVSVSLIDRFDTVLESGRRIASALQQSEIYSEAAAATRHLLRCQRCTVFSLREESGQWIADWVGGDAAAGRDIDNELLQRAMRVKSPVALQEEEVTENAGVAGRKLGAGVEGSTICIPILVRGRPACCLVGAHDEFSSLFGANELRLAEFISCVAGAALENADGFAELQTLNATLEERVQERTEAAESANRAKSQFLAAMSHEIRTPMNGILGMAELALNTSMTSQQRDYLKVVKQSGSALLTLLNDILDLSKIEAGKMELEEIEYDLEVVASDAMRLMSAAAYKKGVELICRVDPWLPRSMVGDPNRLRQIIVNLVGNAIKFTDAGHVLLGVQLIPKRRGAFACRFSVTDTGPGIAPDKQDKVFGAFQQTDASTTRKYGGTGLGLSISAQLVEQMQGRIWLESEVGVGSSFLFEIPLKAAPSGDVNQGAKSPLSGVRYLIEGCCPAAGEVYVEALEHAGASTPSHSLPRDARDRLDALCTAEGSPLLVVDVAGGEAALQLLEYALLGEDRKAAAICLAPPDWVGDVPPGAVRLSKPVAGREIVEAAARACRGDGESVPAASVAPPTPPTRALHVLLADDSPINLQVGRGLLEMLGHQVSTVEGGALALDLLERGDVDVVLLDLEMPEMDGIETVREIRRRDAERGVHTPVAALTAHALHGVREECLAAGMDDCLTKPIVTQELVATLAKLASLADAAGTPIPSASI